VPRRGIGNPADASRGLSGLTCTGPSSCLAVGSIATLGNPQAIPLAESWNGVSWLGRRTERVDGLAAVSCPSASSCLAVGNYINPADNSQGQAQAPNAATWRVVSPPRLLGELSDVSCAGTSFCMVTGGTFSGATLAELWNGSRWQPQASTGGLAQISCVSRSFCMAIGSRGVQSMTWNGAAWRTGASFVTAGTTTSIADLSCTSPTSCMAVGSYTTDPHGGVNVPLAETWNGTRWKWLRAPIVGQNGAFNTVACVRGSGCMAVGKLRGHQERRA
jgi:hypothetical protein